MADSTDFNDTPTQAGQSFDALKSVFDTLSETDEHTTEVTPPIGQLYPKSRTGDEPRQGTGNQLNAYDGELIKRFYLERLKNPTQRLMAQHHRLSSELETVEAELKRYQQLSGQSQLHQQKISNFTQRKLLLTSELDKLNQQLTQTNVLFGLYKKGFQPQPIEGVWQQAIVPLFKALQKHFKPSLALAESQENFNCIEELLQAHIHDANAISPEHLSELISQYDKEMVLAEEKAQALRIKFKMA